MRSLSKRRPSDTNHPAFARYEKMLTGPSDELGLRSFLGLIILLFECIVALLTGLGSPS